MRQVNTGAVNGKMIIMDQHTTAGKGVSSAPYMVAGWSVDPATLRIRNHEKEVKLEPKAMAVLEYLAARPGQVVSRQDLEDAVWTNRVVGYDAISNAIIKLRKAFGDEAQNPQVIETIPKTGYRLIATVELSAPYLEVNERSGKNIQTEQVDAHRAETGVRQEISARGIKVAVKIFLPLVLLIMVALLWFRPAGQIVEQASRERMAFPLPDRPSIAVLPFSNLSDDKQQDYFADGMTEDLITDISKVNGLFVVARNSVFTYKGKTVKARQIAEELGVRYVMEGSVRRVGDQVRINAQLIDAITGGHVWAERYDGSLEDVFSMQDKIAKRIVTALADTLTGLESGASQIETSNTEAYDAYLRGWERYRLGTPEDLSKAVFYFEQAIELDPDYAHAHSALAAVYWKIAAKGWWNKSLHASVSQATEQSSNRG
jgi:TolB-like protein/DNA-binding winged helix-turn-helix (wHTH) protein